MSPPVTPTGGGGATGAPARNDAPFAAATPGMRERFIVVTTSAGGPSTPPGTTRSSPASASRSGDRSGSRAGRHPWWTPVRVVLALTALCFVLGMVQKTTCFEDSWQDGDERYTHMCYSDLPYLYTGRGFAELNWPYSDDAEVRTRYDVMEYPVLISYWA